jgi:TRAP-type C4-dicarboxylate transport system permease small subunit
MTIIEKKYKKRYKIVKDILMLALGLFFIVIGFLSGFSKIDANVQYLNVRYGLTAFALILSGTYLVVQVYRKSRR